MVVRNCGLMLLAAGWGLTSTIWAQPARDGQAEAQFQSALIAFESEEYGAAYRGFMEVYNRAPVHSKTTAALLMAGKSLYRSGDFAQSLSLLKEFHRTYPSSRYMEEVSQVMAYARLELGKEELQSNAVRIGVALPLTGVDPSLSHSLFAGIRLAADLHNSSSPAMIQLVFRDTRNSSAGARSAISELADEGVEAIIGPLFSEEVLAAARRAERAGILMLAPLATDAGVTRGRKHVFQANAVLEEHGAFMARAAIQDLGLDRFGVVAQAGSTVSMARARGFTEAAYRARADIEFNVLLQSSSDWLRLPELIGPEQMAEIDGLFLSVHADSEQDIARIVEGVLTRLGRLRGRPHILGASAWHQVDLDQFAQRLKVTYADVYHVNELSNAVRNFRQAYRTQNLGATPDRLAYIGYDVARLLLQYVEQGEDLASGLRSAARYDGVSTRIRFDESQRNAALFLFHHSPNGGILAN